MIESLAKSLEEIKTVMPYVQLLDINGSDSSALARSHMNDSLPFKRTIEQTTGTVPLAPKTIARIKARGPVNYKLVKVGTLLI